MSFAREVVFYIKSVVLFDHACVLDQANTWTYSMGTANQARLLACFITQYQTCDIVGTAPVIIKEDMFDD